MEENDPDIKPKKLTIFDEQISRKPERYPWAKDAMQAMWDNPWNAKKFNFLTDLQDFKTKLSTEEQDMVVRTLSAIAQIEVTVKAFWRKLGDTLPPMADLGSVMANIEAIHNIAYEKLIGVLKMDHIFEENLKNPIIAGRDKYLRKHAHRYYENSKKQFVYSLILFTVFVENVSLFSQFYIINWLNRHKAVLKEANQQILYTKNEETMHFLSGAMMINQIREEFPEIFDKDLEDKVIKEVKEMINHECVLIKWLLGDVDEDDLNDRVLCELVKYRMNKSLVRIKFPYSVGASPLYEIDPELKEKFYWFEEEILADNSVDFFNQQSVNYAKNNKHFDEDDLF